MNEEMATVRKGLPGGLPNREAHRLLDGKSLRSDTAFSTVYRLSSISLFPVSAQPSLSLSRFLITTLFSRAHSLESSARITRLYTKSSLQNL